MPWTQILAIWGAVTGSIALLWDFYKWKTSGPKLRLKMLPNKEIFIQGQPRNATLYIFADVTNEGTAKTTLRNLGLRAYKTIFHQLVQNTDKNWVVPDPGPYAPRLPHVLEVGEHWSGQILQDAEVENLARTTRLICYVYFGSDKSVSARIVIP